MFDFFLIGEALGVINTYFKEEASEEDFWEVNSEQYPNLEHQFCFMVNPEKLKDKYVQSAEALVVTQDEKQSLLKAFILLHKYSNELSLDASLAERVLFAKSFLPPVFFDQEHTSNGRKVVSFPMKMS